METAALSKVFFLGLLESADERRAVLDDICDRIARDAQALERLGAELEVRPAIRGDDRVAAYQRAVLAYGIGSHRFALEHFTALRDAE